METSKCCGVGVYYDGEFRVCERCDQECLVVADWNDEGGEG